MNKTKVFAVRVRDKYDQKVEDYINSKISNVTWIRDELPGVDLQWNKLRVMNMDIDEPVLVIDIDTFYINDNVILLGDLNDNLNDPLVAREHIHSFGWANDIELDFITKQCFRINDFM